MSIAKIIVTFLLGYLAGALVNFLADALPSFYDKNSIKKIATVQIYLFPIIFDIKMRIVSKRHLIIQGLMPLFCVALLFNPIANIQISWLILLLALFVLISVIDIEHHYILLPTTISGYILAGLVGINVNGLIPTVTGLLAGFLIMLAIYFLGKLYISLRTKLSAKDSINQKLIPLGFGDVNLGGIIGLLLGWPAVLGGITTAMLAAGIISGIMVLLMLIRNRYQPFFAIPYAPFILGAGALLFFS